MPNKFHADKSGSYDSKVERFVENKYRLLEKAGMIQGLHRNTRHFLIIPAITEEITEYKQLKTKVKKIIKTKVLEKAAHYSPDFIFEDLETGEYVALEVKSWVTQKQHDYPLRRKLFKWIIKKHNDRGKCRWRFDEIVM